MLDNFKKISMLLLFSKITVKVAGLKVFLYIDHFYYFFLAVSTDVNTMFRKYKLFTVYYYTS